MRWLVHIAVGVAALLVAGRAARACSLDDVDGALSRDTLNHYFPDALDVLARVVDDRRGRGLPPSPGLTPTPLHIRALMGLAARLDKHVRVVAGEARMGPVAVLLVESMLWVRLPALPSAVAADLHARGPLEGDLVVVTSEDAVREIVAGKVTLGDARAAGKLRLYGAEAAVSGFMAIIGNAGRAAASR